MTDMPEWRSWADAAHKDSLRVGTKKKNRNPRFRCSSCDHKTTKRQAKNTGWTCHFCGAPLRVQMQRQPA